MRAGVRVGPFFASTDLRAKRPSRDGNMAVVYVFASVFAVLWLLVALIGAVVAALIDWDGYWHNVAEIWNLVFGGSAVRMPTRAAR